MPRTLTSLRQFSASRLLVVGVVCVVLAGLAVSLAGGVGAAEDPAAIDVRTDTAADHLSVEDDVDGSFGRTMYETPAGDRVEVSVSFDGLEEGYVLIGGDHASGSDATNNFFDVVHVEGGSATFTVNTRLLGTNASTEAVYGTDDGVTSYVHSYGSRMHPDETDAFADIRFEDEHGTEVAETLAEFRGEIGVSELPAPLIPQRYRLVAAAPETIVVRDDGAADAGVSLDRSNLYLTEPETNEEIALWTAPPASASEASGVGDVLSEAIGRETVTKGDRIVVGLEGNGIWGTIAALAADEDVFEDGTGTVLLADLLEAPEGISLSIEQTNPGRNQQATTFEFDEAVEDEAYLFLEEGDASSLGEIYLVIDTRDGSGFDGPLEDGDEFRVEFGVDGDAGERFRFGADGSKGHPEPFDQRVDVRNQYPYYDYDDIGFTTARTFTVEEPVIEFDRVPDDGDLILGEGSDVEIAGRTNMAPGGPELTLDVISDDRGPPSTFERADLSVDEDGTFSTSVDLSAVEDGASVAVELYLHGQLYDRRTAHLAEDPDDPSVFEITDSSTSFFVPRGNSLDQITTTVENTGLTKDTQELTLEIGNRTLAARTLTLGAGEHMNVTFDDVTIDRPPGEYEYTLATDDDETTDLMIVQEPPHMSIEAIDVPETATRGEQPAATATIRNAGELGASREVAFTVGDSGAMNRTVDLASGETATVTFEPVRLPDDSGQYDYAVDTGDDRASGTIAVRDPPILDIEPIGSIEPTLTVVSGQPLADLEAVVENTGGETGTQDVRMWIENESLDSPVNTSRTVTVAAGETETVDFSGAAVDLPAGEYAYTLATDDDAANGTLVVERPARFEVASVSAPVTVSANETRWNASATIENVGDVAGAETVSLWITNGGDGTVVDRQAVELAGGETGTVEFTGSIGGAGQSPGEHRFVVETGTDTENGTLVIEDDRGSEPTTPENGSDEVPGEGSDAFMGLVPPIGVRESVGGILIVGALYLLGGT